MDFIEACRKFISIDTTPHHGTKDLAEFAAQLCGKFGFHVEFQPGSIGDNAEMNIIARPQKSQPNQELLLQTHLDTVDPGLYAMWSETAANPFNASIYQNKIYGLGAADVKLDFLCKIWAAKDFVNQKNFNLPFALVGTYGEELGMAGILKLIRKNKVSAKMALVGEPTNLQLVHAAKGFAVVEITVPFSEEEKRYRLDHNLNESTSTQSKLFLGKSAHSSTPQLGESAIKKLLFYLRQLPDGIAIMDIDGGVNYNTVPSNAMIEIDIVGGLRDTIVQKVNYIYSRIEALESEFTKYQDTSFNPTHPTLNIGIVRTNEEYIKFMGSCRIPPIVTNEVYENWMKNLKVDCEKVGCSLRVSDYKRPYSTSLDSNFVKTCQNELKAMGLNPECSTQASTNEASILSRIGVECLSFGPGIRDGNAHTPSEHVDIKDLQKAIEFYKRIIERVCL